MNGGLEELGRFVGLGNGRGSSERGRALICKCYYKITESYASIKKILRNKEIIV